MFDKGEILPIPGYIISRIMFSSLAIYFAYYVLIRPRLSVLRDLPGPQAESAIFGNVPSMLALEPGRYQVELMRKYGGMVHCRFLMQDQILITDPVALNHILSNAYDFPKPSGIRGSLMRIVGNGLVFAEGDDHKRQKRLLQAAFTGDHLRALMPTFFEQTYRLRDLWTDLINEKTVEKDMFKNDAAASAYREQRDDVEPEAVLDVSNWMSRLTIEIIGLAGFGYTFGSFDPDARTAPLESAFRGMMNTSKERLTPGGLLIGLTMVNTINRFPLLQYLPLDALAQVRDGFRTIEQEARKIVEEAKNEVLGSGSEASIKQRKDLMALLIKANVLATNPKARMSDDELMGQMTTFMLAGYETTALALTWLFWTLSRYRPVQDRLRAEIREARAKALAEGKDEIGYDELDALEYLGAVVREILRTEPSAPNTRRQPTKDSIIPLSEPITTKSGKTLTSIFVPAGTDIFVSMVASNMSTQVFGDDAEVFRPERWLDGTVSEKGSAPGVYSQLMTFLGGPRGCIGYKFAVMEIKAIIFVLIDQFVFEERDSSGGPELERRAVEIVAKPIVIGEEELGSRLPMRIRLAKR
ncbi:cytochrome P450, family 46, subfamily A (cholesterol 24(S)-hydroxylase) [Pseudohyphozyma bogoriensis]|nr:cytochrome P450, family 46, subfamily A (cholesterol 24(S)-hydroxylase) [Pseudohyphozyma bogoriensis]